MLQHAHTLNSICLLRLSAIGDVCHTVPVLRALQDRWPEAEITWVIGRAEAGLVGDIEGVEFVVFDKARGPAAYRALSQQLAGRRFDVFLHMQVSLRASLASLVIRADRRIGFDRRRARNGQWLFTTERISASPHQHVMESLLEFARVLDADITRPRWAIPVSAADEEFAADQIPQAGDTLLISPCSSHRSRNYRNWRPERYAAVIDHAAAKHGLRTLITGGSTRLEHEYAEAIRAASRHPPRSLVGQTTLKQVLALLGRARAIVCPDSGPAHMATAAGCPAIGLYATTNPGRTGPYHSHHWTVDRYAETLRAETGKTVADVRWGRRVRSPAAMDTIEVADVTGALDAMMMEVHRPESSEIS